MSNQIILSPQKFSFKDLISQFPSGKFKKKLFFQSELRVLANGDATFGVIAYPAWRGKEKWSIGTKISGIDTGKPDVIPFTPPLAFANNELLIATKLSGKKRKKEKNVNQDLIRLMRKVCKSKKMIARSSFHFKATITKNPHLQYDVTLDTGDTTLTMQTNPSPPARPQD